MSETFHDEPKRRSFFGPIILIGLGIFFLLNNLGVLQEGAFENLWPWWPVLLILWGINGLVTENSIVGAAAITGLGLLILLYNLGVVQVSPFITVIRLWPLILIGVGVSIIVGRRTLLHAAIGYGIVLLILAAGVFYTEKQYFGDSTQSETIAEPLGDFDEARVVLAPSIASFNLTAVDDSSNFIEGVYAFLQNESFNKEFAIKDGTATFRLESDSDNVVMGVWGDYGMLWDLSLNTAVPVDLDINLGVGETNIDLTGLSLTGLDISEGVGVSRITLPDGEYRAKFDFGVGSNTLVLPENGRIRVDIDQGVGTIIIRIPENMAARISADRGIAALQVPGGFERNGDIYTSPGYGSAENRVEIFLDIGVGNISVLED